MSSSNNYYLKHSKILKDNLKSSVTILTEVRFDQQVVKLSQQTVNLYPME